jgi:hypothetical protein
MKNTFVAIDLHTAESNYELCLEFLLLTRRFGKGETPVLTALCSGLVPALETKVDVLLDHVVICLVQLIAFSFVILI